MKTMAIQFLKHCWCSLKQLIKDFLTDDKSIDDLWDKTNFSEAEWKILQYAKQLPRNEFSEDDMRELAMYFAGWEII